jgi:pimeloyl-ACP methyl ester carboxylesterase
MNRKYFIYSLIAIFSILFAVSCDLTKDDDQIPISEHKYLIDYKLINTAPQAFIKLALENMEKDFGDLPKFSDKVEYGVWIYRVNYKTKFKNKDVVASGLVCVPATESSNPFPMLSFQNGTNTLHEKAPSVNSDDEFLTLIQIVASFGYVVTIPDYLGFGASKDMHHPYLDKPSAITSVTDLIEAAKEITGPKSLDMNVTNDLSLLGYSQGGWASMAVKEWIEKNAGGNYALKGTASGGAPYDLTRLTEYIMGLENYPMPVYVAYLFHSLIQTGTVAITYSDIFNAPYDNRIKDLFNGQRDNDYINNQLTTTIADLFSVEFRTNYKQLEKYSTLRAALVTNSVQPWKTTTPTFLRHGTNDTYVPAFQSMEMYQGFLDKETAQEIVGYAGIPMMSHYEAALPFGIFAINWLLSIR